MILYWKKTEILATALLRAKANIVVEWKKQHGLRNYFNCPGSPDRAPIEDVSQPMKQHIRTYGYWEPDETRTLALEGQAKIDID
jgi:hypothetical protein